MRSRLGLGRRLPTESTVTPGGTHESVRRGFRAPQAEDLVRVGRAFEIWYGGTVGRGSVEPVGRNEPQKSG
jgi:hypothetical protein